jgi:REP element-mobilizing transposase RayT
MRTRKQPFLAGFEKLGVREFGGSLIKGNAREARPIAIKKPMHLVMRSSLATGELSFLRSVRSRKIEAAVKRLGERTGVRVYRYANSGNHIHLLVLPRSRAAFKAYLRAITGLIARITLGVERGRALGKKFWDARPYTRIIEWGREFKAVAAYVAQNTLEALGFIPYQPRKHKSRLQSASA